MKTKLGVIFGTSQTDLPFPIVPAAGNFHSTPFGDAPEDLTFFVVNPDEVLTINRHGAGHVFSPSGINYRAIIFKMKEWGVTHLVSFSAVGSLKEEIVPGKTIVIPDQIFDDTKGIRKHTFFEGHNDVVAHVSLADPICGSFAKTVAHVLNESDEVKAGKFNCQLGGTYVVIEGPTYSTRAKSRHYKNDLKADVVGMTAWPEAALAREAGMHYAVVCFPADYDSWRTNTAGVDADEVKQGLIPFANVPNILLPPLIRALCAKKPKEKCIVCPNSLKGFAVHSDIMLTWEQRQRYSLLLPD